MDWQVQSGTRTAVFVSAASADLGACRRMAVDVLLGAGVHPVLQDYFGPDSRSILELLSAKIAACDAVVCLIGHAFGCAPPFQPSPRSYTQIEFDIAERLNKPTYLFIASDAFSASAPPPESPELRELQRGHRQTLMAGTRKYETFASQDELRDRLQQLVQPLLAHGTRRAMKYVHPPPEPLHFVGREDELDQLQAALDSPIPAVIAVLGMGGQGKTALVARALKARAGLPFADGIWVSAYRGGFTFSHLLDLGLQAFVGSGFDKRDTPRWEERLARLLLALQERPRIIVIDGFERWLVGGLDNGAADRSESVNPRSGTYEGLDQLLSEASGLDNGSHLLLTTRALPLALESVTCSVLPMVPGGIRSTGLAGLTEQAAIELVRSLGVAAPDEKLREAVAPFTGHPLALTTFAGLVRNLGPSWERFWASRAGDPIAALGRILDETCQRLANPPLATRVLGVASVCPGDVPLGLLAWQLECDGHRPEDAWMHALSVAVEAASWSLGTWVPAAETLSLHSLVRAHFASGLPDDNARQLHARAATWYANAGASETQSELATREPPVYMAVRHALAAHQAERAVGLLYRTEPDRPSLFDWLVSEGHLWECAELLGEIAAEGVGPTRVECLLARAHILHRLDLPQRGDADLDAAVAATGGPRTESGQTLLARCLEAKAHICADAGAATLACDLYSQAADELGHGALSDDARSNLARVFANRATAKRACGDWDGAGQDLSRAEEILARVPSAEVPTVGPLRQVIITQRAALRLDCGKPTEALTELQGTPCRWIDPGDKVLDKGHVALCVTYAAALIASHREIEAVSFLDPLVGRLSGDEASGRRESRSLLALALVNRSEARLRSGDDERACEDAMTSVELYRELLRQESIQFTGQLFNALFQRAACECRLGRHEACTNDIVEAVGLASRWMRAWGSESDAVNVFLRRARQTLESLPSDHGSAKTAVIDGLQTCREIQERRPKDFAASRAAETLLRELDSVIGPEWLGPQT